MPAPKPKTRESEILRINDVMQILGRSRSFVWNLIRRNDGQFPQPVRLGGLVCWHRREIDNYLKNLPRIELTGVGAIKVPEGSKVGRPRKVVA